MNETLQKIMCSPVNTAIFVKLKCKKNKIKMEKISPLRNYLLFLRVTPLSDYYIK